MFVEIVRLLVVAAATAAGYVLGRGAGTGQGSGPVVGATLGALVGYVAGGVFGRQLRRTMGRVERDVARTPAAVLLAGTAGAALAGLASAVLAAPALVLVPGRWGWPLAGLVVWVGIYEGYRIAAGKSAELLGLAGLRAEVAPAGVLVDTSAVIDGRILALARCGVLPGRVLLPRFVLDELQSIADAGDGSRRRRGRRGLQILAALGRDGPGVTVLDDEVPEFDAVDAKLVALACRLGAPLCTTDAALVGVAELRGVRCLNPARLAEELRPEVLPGELVEVAIARPGREPGQGVGFLDDGTMVVVGGAADLVGRDVRVRVTQSVRTSVGRMLFATVDPAPSGVG